MAVTVRETASGNASGASATATTTSNVAVGDLLVCFFGCDFYTAAEMNAPTGTSGTWTLEATGDLGSNNPHIKIYTRKVTAAGAQTVTVNQVQDSEVYNLVYVLRNGQTDAAGAGGSGASTTSPVAPAVTTVNTTTLLLCGYQTGNGQTNLTAPSGMGNVIEVEDVFSTMASCRQDLTTAGSTGTKTGTFSTARPYASASLAVRTVFLPPDQVAGQIPTNVRAAVW